MFHLNRTARETAIARETASETFQLNPALRAGFHGSVQRISGLFHNSSIVVIISVMPQAWLKDESCVNFREDNHFDPPRFISLEKLKASTGVECYKVDVDDLKNAQEYWKLRKDRGYDYEDVVEISEKLMKKEEYDAKLKLFYSEHLHQDEEIRLFLEGSGYFDVRDDEDNWVRIHASKNDLLILPAGIYHRFTLDQKNYAKVQRLFSGIPVWTAKFRPEADEEPIRKQYMNLLLQQAA